MLGHRAEIVCGQTQDVGERGRRRGADDGGGEEGFSDIAELNVLAEDKLVEFRQDGVLLRSRQREEYDVAELVHERSVIIRPCGVRYAA